MPVSLTAKCSVTRVGVRCSTRHAHTTSPAAVNLTALPSTFSSTWRRRPASPSSTLGHVGRDVAGELDALFRGAQREQLGSIADCLAQVELGALEIEPPRLDLREVEDVVDDRRAATRPDDFTVGGSRCCSAVSRVCSASAVIPRMRVERRADLVAHVGEKGALGLGRLLGAALARFQLLDQLRQSRGLVLERAMT